MDEKEIERPAVAPGRRPPIRPEMTVRQAAADYPASREVFRRHGEPERSSAKFGHLEPLDRFAQRHGVTLDTLLAELSGAAGVEIGRDDPSAGRAHRPFVAAALAVTLSLGAGWGTLLLIEVGRRGSLAAIPAAQVVAHGEAQFWGFVAPFAVECERRKPRTPRQDSFRLYFGVRGSTTGRKQR